jgi:pyruvate dehydrogenase E1 component alpha subunit
VPEFSLTNKRAQRGNAKNKKKNDRRKVSDSAASKQMRSVAFEVRKDLQTPGLNDMLQILDPAGRVTGEDPEIPTELLLEAYRNMVLTRLLDEKLISLQRQGKIGTYVSCSGQEATQIGAVLALSKDKDWIFPTYRDMGMIIQAGVSLKELINRMFGNSEDKALGRDLPNLFGWKSKKIVSFAAPIASHVPLATGFAMAAKLRKEDLVTVATFGDGATSSGEFHVAMNFSGVYKAPTIFICENNQYAISVPIRQQTASESIAMKAHAYGFDGVKVDGNDLFAVYAAVRRAVEKARKGEGPTLIECLTYRLGSHSTADDWTKYRPKDEVESWKKKDPIPRLKEYLIADRRAWSEENDAKLRSEIEAEIGQAVTSGEKIPPPDVKTLFQDVYSSIPKNLEEQSKELFESEES